MKKYPYRPESLMMSYAYHSDWSEGAMKCPIFQTSTYTFPKAEDGKALFARAYGLDETDKSKKGLIYSRLNHPDLEILEHRLCLWDRAENAAVFSSGMAAISSVLMEFLQPGDLFAYTMPVYGGTAHFINHYLPKLGVHLMELDPDLDQVALKEALQKHPQKEHLKMIYMETPANPTNRLIDIEMCKKVASQFQDCLVVVDNTYLGPIWQSPMKQGADLVIYSATKFLGGHSDLIAGAVLGKSELIKQLKSFRTFTGNMLNPWESWLLMRSLETLKMRMETQSRNAQKIAEYLQKHRLVEEVKFLGLLTEEDGIQYDIYQRQCTGPGSMISVYVKGGEEEAFRFLNHLRLIKRAVSLGATESLAQHPATMTHAEMDEALKERLKITPNLVRISVGVEHIEDLLFDLESALTAMETPLIEEEVTSGNKIYSADI